MNKAVAERLLARLSRLHKCLRQTELPPPMTPERLSTLSVIAQRGPVSVTALADLEGVRPATMSRMVSALDREGFIRRRGDKVDARGVLVTLTPKGRRCYERGRQIQLKRLVDALEAMPPVDATALQRLAELLLHLSVGMKSANAGNDTKDG